MTMEQIVTLIRDTLEAIRSSNTRYPQQVVNRVFNVVKEVIKTSNNNWEIQDFEVELIKNALNISGNPRSHISIIHHDCYNELIYRLRASNSISADYINTPQRASRRLIVDFNDKLLQDIRAARFLTDDLLKLRIPRSSDVSVIEADYVCSFVASASIFGVIVHPDFHKSLLSLKVFQVALNPARIILFYNHSDTYSRYFLPFPASAYLFRCILYFQRIRRITRWRPDDRIFPASSVEGFQSAFRAWTIDRLKQPDSQANPHLTIPSLRAAVVALSSTPLSNGSKYPYPLPPFLAAIHERTIKSFSFDDSYFKQLLSPKNNHKKPGDTDH